MGEMSPDAPASKLFLTIMGGKGLGALYKKGAQLGSRMLGKQTERAANTIMKSRRVQGEVAKRAAEKAKLDLDNPMLQKYMQSMTKKGQAQFKSHIEKQAKALSEKELREITMSGLNQSTLIGLVAAKELIKHETTAYARRQGIARSEAKGRKAPESFYSAEAVRGYFREQNPAVRLLQEEREKLKEQQRAEGIYLRQGRIPKDRQAEIEREAKIEEDKIRRDRARILRNQSFMPGYHNLVADLLTGKDTRDLRRR